MAYKPRYRGMTARAILTNAERKLRAGEPLSEALSAHLADAIKAMLEGVKPETAWGLSNAEGHPDGQHTERNFMIVEYVDILKRSYPTSINRHVDMTVFDAVADDLKPRGDDGTILTPNSVKDVYYETRKSPLYLAYMKDAARPDLVTVEQTPE